MSARSQANRPAGRPRDVSDVLDEAEMDETLDETFPASDAPSWTLGVDEHRREPSPDATSGEPDSEPEE
jgi:hypothetical protein